MGQDKAAMAKLALLALCFLRVAQAMAPEMDPPPEQPGDELGDELGDQGPEGAEFARTVARMYATNRTEEVQEAVAAARELLVAGCGDVQQFVLAQAEDVEGAVPGASDCFHERRADFAAIEQRCSAEPLECANATILAALAGPDDLHSQIFQLRTNRTALKHEYYKCGVDDACREELRSQYRALDSARRRLAAKAGAAREAADAAKAEAKACLRGLERTLLPDMHRLALQVLQCLEARIGGAPPADPAAAPAAAPADPAQTEPFEPPKKVLPMALRNLFKKE